MSSGPTPQPFRARFRVLDPGILGPGAEVAAHLLGPDEVPVAGEVRFEPFDGGLDLVAAARTEETAALALPVRAGRAGTLLLPTCLLPSRAEPYRLGVELARHRIKQFIQKSEDWQMWDPGLCAPAQKDWDRARIRFAAALVHDDPRMAEAGALASLETGVLASESLAFLHADTLLGRRFAGKVASSTTLGTTLRPAALVAGIGPELEGPLRRDFDVVTIPIDWRLLERVEGKPDFTALDATVRWATERKKPILFGPLVDLGPGRLPDWIAALAGDYEAFRDRLYDHVERIARRYAGAVGIWNVASGVHANRVIRLTPERMVDLTRRLQVAVRQHARKARTLVELLPVAGELGNGHRALTAWRYLERLQSEGAAPSAVGIRLGAGLPGGFVTRDLLSIADQLDRFAGGDIKLLVTAFGAPAKPVAPNAGHWRDGWTPEGQAAWAGRLMQLALARPWIDTLFWAQTSDRGEAGVPGLGLGDEHGVGRPVLARLGAIRTRLRKPLAAEGGTPAAPQELPWNDGPGAGS